MISGGPESNTDSTTVFFCCNFSLELKWVLTPDQANSNTHNKWSLGQVGECKNIYIIYIYLNVALKIIYLINWSIT